MESKECNIRKDSLTNKYPSGKRPDPSGLLSQRPNSIYKVLILGNPGMGKTSLILKYVNDTFTKNYKATIGVDFLTKIIDENTVLQLWDIAGQ